VFLRALDNAGNISALVSQPVNIDVTPPVVTVTGVSQGANYALGSVPAAGCDTSDTLSGVATNASVSVTGGLPSGFGVFTATCSGGTDKAGNIAAPVSVTYSVPFPFSGFFSPVANWPSFNNRDAGAALPVQFGLGGNQGLSIVAAGYPKSQAIACGSTVRVDGDTPTATAGQSGVTFDSISSTYTYVWKTDGSWSGTCRQFVVKLVDGTVHRANLRFQ
jgi:hypothetical protein